MSSLVSLRLNEKLGILECQEVEFGNEVNGLIEIKAQVGSGKTTAKHGVELALSGGNQQQLPFDVKKFDKADVEVKLTYGDQPIYLRTYKNAAGNLTSTAYIKTDDGKIAKDPVIKGKKLTPAVLRDILKTDLTFGVENFLSENPRTHMDFMMKIYSHKLAALGVVFDTKSEAYKGSILYRLEQAKLNRADKHSNRRQINGFKEALIEEGYDENNVKPIVDIDAIRNEMNAFVDGKKKAHGEAVKKYYEDIAKKKEDVQNRIEAIQQKANELISSITSYNNSISTEIRLWETNTNQDIEKFNQEQAKLTAVIEKATSLLASLTEMGYAGTDVESWIESLPKAQPLKTLADYERPNFIEVPFVDGKIAPEAFTKSFTPEIDAKLVELSSLRKQVAPLIAEKESIGNEQPPVEEPIDTQKFEDRINKAEASNLIARRWAAFYDWQIADEEVKSIWREYCEMYSQIDLGVPGLSIRVVGDEDNSEIRTHYNGVHNPTFFGNEQLEHRLITQYSATQRPIIAILLQIYLLEEKIKKGEDGLRLMWIECPIDNKTRDLLVDVQKKHNITIIVGVTGDFSFEGLKDGEFLIENGVLLSNGK